METNLVDNCMRLGFGMMRLPRIKGTNTIDLELSRQMVDAFMEAGGKYFDTAYVYEGSEAATKATLCEASSSHPSRWSSLREPISLDREPD